MVDKNDPKLGTMVLIEEGGSLHAAVLTCDGVVIRLIPKHVKHKDTHKKCEQRYCASGDELAEIMKKLRDCTSCIGGRPRECSEETGFGLELIKVNGFAAALFGTVAGWFTN